VTYIGKTETRLISRGQNLYIKEVNTPIPKQSRLLNRNMEDCKSDQIKVMKIFFHNLIRLKECLSYPKIS